MQNTRASQPATGNGANPADVGDQIRQTILAAQDAARQAAIEGAQRPGNGTQTIIVGPARVQGMPARPPFVYTTGAGDNSTPDIPPQVVDISIAFFIMCAVMVIGWPLARAFGKRLERRGDVPALSAGATQQLNRIEQAVEAMAIEVERISESQRFLAKLQNAQAPRELKSS